MHKWFDIPEESEHYPDILCDSCNAMLRWCPECRGYHHLNKEMWVTNHWHGTIIVEDGEIGSRKIYPQPVTYDEYIVALKEVMDEAMKQ